MQGDETAEVGLAEQEGREEPRANLEGRPEGLIRVRGTRVLIEAESWVGILRQQQI